MPGIIGGKAGMRLTAKEAPEKKKSDSDYIFAGRHSSRQAINLRDIPGLFEKIRQMTQSLSDLSAELCMRMPDGQEIWLVPKYTEDKTRKEMSFEDITHVTVLCASFGGKVTDIKFSTVLEPLPDVKEGVVGECEEEGEDQ